MGSIAFRYFASGIYVHRGDCRNETVCCGMPQRPRIDVDTPRPLHPQVHPPLLWCAPPSHTPFQPQQQHLTATATKRYLLSRTVFAGERGEFCAHAVDSETRPQRVVRFGQYVRLRSMPSAVLNALLWRSRRQRHAIVRREYRSIIWLCPVCAQTHN